MKNLVSGDEPNRIEEADDGVDELHALLPDMRGLAVHLERLSQTPYVGENTYLLMDQIVNLD